MAVLADLPREAFLTDPFGDVDLVMVFRRVPDDPALVPAGGVPSTDPAAGVARP